MVWRSLERSVRRASEGGRQVPRGALDDPSVRKSPAKIEGPPQSKDLPSDSAGLSPPGGARADSASVATRAVSRRVRRLKFGRCAENPGAREAVAAEAKPLARHCKSRWSLLERRPEFHSSHPEPQRQVQLMVWPQVQKNSHHSPWPPYDQQGRLRCGLSHHKRIFQQCL